MSAEDSAEVLLTGNPDQFVTAMETASSAAESAAAQIDAAFDSSADSVSASASEMAASTSASAAEMASSMDAASAEGAAAVAANAGVASDGLVDNLAAGGVAAGAAARDGVAEGTEGVADDLGDTGAAAGTKLADGVTTAAEGMAGEVTDTAAVAGAGVAGGLEKGAEDAKGTFTKIGEYGAIAFAGLTAVTIDFADKFDAANVTLQTAVKATGASLTAVQPSITATYQKMAALGFNSTDTASALAGLTTATGSVSKAETLMGEAADLARFKHISLATAAGVLQKVEAGNVRVLTQMGINLDIGSGKLTALQTASEGVTSAQLALKTVQTQVATGYLTGVTATNALATAQNNLSNAQLKLSQDGSAVTQVLTVLTKKTHSAATTYANTLPGAMSSARAEMHNVGTEIGDALEPKLADLAKGVSDVIEWFDKNKTVAEVLAGTVGGVLAVAFGVFAVNKITSFVGSMKDAWTEITKVGSKIGTLTSKLFGLNTPAENAGNALQGTGTAAENASAKIDTSMGTAGTAVEDMAADASTASGEFAGSMATISADSEAMSSSVAADAAEAGGADGLGEMAGGFTGMLGPIGLAAGAIGAVFLPKLFDLFNSGPTWKAVDTNVKQFGADIAAITGKNITQIATIVHQWASKAQSAAAAGSKVTPNSTAGATATGDYTKAITNENKAATAAANLAANQAALNQMLGLTPAQADAVATAVTVKLTGSMTKFDVHQIVNHLKEFGTATEQAAAHASAGAAVISQSAQTAARKVITADSVMTAGHKAALELLIAESQATAPKAIAKVADSFKDGLPEFEAQLKQVGVTIPKKYLDLLTQNMTTGGKVSVASLTAQVQGGHGGIGNAFTTTIGTYKGPLTKAKSDLPKGFTAALSSLEKAIQTHKGKMSATMADAVTKTLQEVIEHEATFGPTGTAMVKAITTAINADSQSAATAAANMVTQAVAAANAAAEAHSPSELMAREVGRPLAAGIVTSLLDAKGDARAAGQSLVGSVADGASSALATNGGTTTSNPSAVHGGSALAGGGTGGNTTFHIDMSGMQIHGVETPEKLAAEMLQPLRTQLYQLQRATGPLKFTSTR